MAIIVLATLGLFDVVPEALAACRPTADPVEVAPPSFSAANSNYRVQINGKPVAVLEQGCEGPRRACNRRTTNSIASATMQVKSDGSYVPMTIVVEKMTYQPPSEGAGWKIRPSRFQDDGTVTNVDDSLLATNKSISFTVTKPCQLSVELIGEAAMFVWKNEYWGFPAFILAINPPESSWPQQKPTVTVDPFSGDIICISAVPDRDCIIATPDHDCSPLIIPKKTDYYLTSRQSKVFRWGDGCGLNPKKLVMNKGASLFMDDDVIVFARVESGQDEVGVFGYGVLSSYYMHGAVNKATVNGLIHLNNFATIYGPVLMDSTYRNMNAGRNSTIGWTKSFAWQPQTDGIDLRSSGHLVHDNFFKVQDDVLKAYYADSIFRNNVIWHGTIGRAIHLSWGNWEENVDDRTSTTQILETSIIHDYAAFAEDRKLDPDHPPELALQAMRVLEPALIGAQHSMDNHLGAAGSPIIIRGLHVEGPVGVLFAVSSGYSQLGGKATWQSANGCGGDVNLHIEGMDLEGVHWLKEPSFAGGCDADYEYSGIKNAVCLCTSTMCDPSGNSYCRVNLDFVGGYKDSLKPDAAKLEDMFVLGRNTAVQGMATRRMQSLPTQFVV